MSDSEKNSIGKILPVLFGFFVMGFCDVVGISTSYIKIDFNLSETMAGFIPTMVFLWFLLLSVPTAMLMNRIGRKRSVQLSNVITVVGMMIPFFSYNLVTCMIAFALLGIGNTILQVSLNPLLTNVIKGERLTSSLTAGQVIKA
ncbi:MAG: MFS transporter, partial [Bacteroidia bacterium]|nr:MFS transporter [Bacteroidia bacterium]